MVKLHEITTINHSEIVVIGTNLAIVWGPHIVEDVVSMIIHPMPWEFKRDGYLNPCELGIQLAWPWDTRSGIFTKHMHEVVHPFLKPTR